MAIIMNIYPYVLSEWHVIYYLLYICDPVYINATFCIYIYIFTASRVQKRGANFFPMHDPRQGYIKVSKCPFNSHQRCRASTNNKPIPYFEIRHSYYKLRDKTRR